MQFSSLYLSNKKQEIELLLLCTRVQINANDTHSFKILVKADIDWQYLLNIGHRNKILPLLYFHLNSICPKDVPEEHLNFLKKHFEHSCKSNLFLSRELLRLLNLFNSHNIPVIPFKGPVLTTSLYSNLTLREFSDLDILVPRESIPKVKDLLISENFKPQFNLKEYQEEALLNYHEQLTFKNSHGTLLDVHVSIAPKHFYNNSKFDLSLWNNLETVKFCDTTVQTLNSEYLLYVLCIHAAKHLWQELRLITDLSELITKVSKNKDFNWDKIINHSKEIGINKILCYSTFFANKLLDTKLPANILNEIKAEVKEEKLIQKIESVIFNPVPVTISFKNEVLFHTKLFDKPSSIIQYLQHFALTPSMGDWKFLSLPKHLNFLYFGLRPIRLFWKYIKKVLNPKKLAGFLPTPIEVAEEMLTFAEIASSDVIYDLGCGDGRILITAAKKYGAKGVGIDIDPKRIQEANNSAHKENVSHLVRFIQKDAMAVDISEATILVLFLPAISVQKLKPKLDKSLKKGTYIVSHGDSYFKDWIPEKIKTTMLADGSIHTIYLWRMTEKTSIPNNENNLVLSS